MLLAGPPDAVPRHPSPAGRVCGGLLRHALLTPLPLHMLHIVFHNVQLAAVLLCVFPSVNTASEPWRSVAVGGCWWWAVLAMLRGGTLLAEGGGWLCRLTTACVRCYLLYELECLPFVPLHPIPYL